MSNEPGRRERRKQATRAAILDVAIRLMQERGIDGMTMEELAVQADVAKATLYAYYPSKEALIGGWIRLENERHDAGMATLLREEPTTRRRLHRLFRQTSAWQERHRPLLERYIPYRLASVVRCRDEVQRRQEGSGFKQHLDTVLAAGQDLGDVRADLPVAALTRALESAYLYVLLGWLGAPGEVDLGEACVAMVDLFLDGAAAQGGQP